jgi:ABC-type molybdenum transport system ATPase subunit/photorepair protein PhrA
MFPLLNQYMNTLSTGQKRQVLLVGALVSRPNLLVLDNAYDGLDIKGRMGLRDVIKHVLQGFQMDILVQGVGDARDAALAQVLLLMHHLEEISDGSAGSRSWMALVKKEEGGMRTEDGSGWTKEELVTLLVSSGMFEGKG